MEARIPVNSGEEDRRAFGQQRQGFGLALRLPGPQEVSLMSSLSSPQGSAPLFRVTHRPA